MDTACNKHAHTVNRLLNILIAIMLLITSAACQTTNTVSQEEYNKLQRENVELKQQEKDKELEALKKERDELKEKIEQDKQARLSNRVADLENKLQEARNETKEAKQAAKAAQNASTANRQPNPPASNSGNVYVGSYSDGTGVYLLPSSVYVTNRSPYNFSCTVKAGGSSLNYVFYSANGTPYYRNNEGYEGQVFGGQSPVAASIYRYVISNY